MQILRYLFVENMSFNSLFLCRHENIMDCLKIVQLLDCFKSSVIKRKKFNIFLKQKNNLGQIVKTQDKRTDCRIRDVKIRFM